MTKLEKANDSLSEEEYRQFRHWFPGKDWEEWDRKIAEDSRVGKLDFLVKEALEAKKENRVRNKTWKRD